MRAWASPIPATGRQPGRDGVPRLDRQRLELVHTSNLDRHCRTEAARFFWGQQVFTVTYGLVESHGPCGDPR